MKRFTALIGALLGLVVLAELGQAACSRTDFWCYQSGPSGSLSTQARLDSNGNQTLNGNLTASGNLAAVAGTFSGGLGLQSATITQINAMTAPAGTMAYCNNCTTAGGAGTVCISTGAATFSFVLSTGTACK